MGDAAALANRIQQVLADPQEAARRAANARELVLAKYTRQAVLDELVRLINQTE